MGLILVFLACIFCINASSSCLSPCTLFNSFESCTLSASAAKNRCVWCRPENSDHGEFCTDSCPAPLSIVLPRENERDIFDSSHNCSQRTSCASCASSNENCAWCENILYQDISYCSVKQFCGGNAWKKSETCSSVAPSPAPELDIPIERARRCMFYNSNCAYCKSMTADRCGYCTTSAGYSLCTVSEYCRFPWVFSSSLEQCPSTDTTLPSTPTTSTTPSTTTTTTSSSSETTSTTNYRCRNLRMCGDCVNRYLCQWCPAQEGFCVGQDDPFSVGQCNLLGLPLSTTECNCTGWTNCSQCRAKGCSYCSVTGNPEKNFCFNTADASLQNSSLQRCIQQQGRIEYNCPLTSNSVSEDRNPKIISASEFSLSEKLSTFQIIAITTGIFVVAVFFVASTGFMIFVYFFGKIGAKNSHPKHENA